MSVASARRLCLAVVFPALLFTLSTAHAGTPAQSVDIPAKRDTTIYSESAGLSNGIGGTVVVGADGSGNERRALLYFDLAEGLPEDATITSAELLLEAISLAGDKVTFNLHPLKRHWGEAASQPDVSALGGGDAKEDDATWGFAFFDSEEWDTAGGDFDLTASATATITQTGAVTVTGGLLVDVAQAWADTPADNFGWLLVTEETTAGAAVQFHSRESEPPAKPPVLRLTYTAPEPTLLPCPPDALAGQSPAPVESMSAGFYASDTGRDDERIEYFSGVTETIEAIRWWGTNRDTQNILPCTRASGAFRVAFYEDNGGVPGGLIATQTVDASQTNTGVHHEGRLIYRYDAALPTPLSLANGWFSIQGTDDESCVFYWYRSTEGDGIHFRTFAFETQDLIGDFAYCFLPEFIPVEGEGEGEGEGAVEGGSEGEGAANSCIEGEFLEGEPEGELLLPCPADSLRGQPPARFTTLAAGVAASDTNRDDERIEFFTNVTEPIGGVSWWGVNAVVDGFDECSRANTLFGITFYEPGLDGPGAVVSSQTVTAVETDTGLDFNGRSLYHYEATLPQAVDRCAGWVSVQANGDAACSFFWYRSEQGDGNHARRNLGAVLQVSGNMSFCLLPVTTLGEGEGSDEAEAEGEGAAEGGSEGVSEGEGSREGEGEGSIEGSPEGEGGDEGEQEGENEGAIEPLFPCAPLSVASQLPVGLASPFAGVVASDTNVDDERIESFEFANAPIGSLRWWGVTSENGGAASCSRTSDAFLITFYADNFGMPGTEVSAQTVSATEVSTGMNVNGRLIYQYDADLTDAVNLTSGWFSIQATGDAACTFFWYRSDEEDNGHYRASSTFTTEAPGDLAYCLVSAFDYEHTADPNNDGRFSLGEVLRVIQFYNAGGYSCADGTEDGYQPGPGDESCTPHDSDYGPQDWVVALSELLRLIQFFNTAGYQPCMGSEDGYCVTPF